VVPGDVVAYEAARRWRSTRSRCGRPGEFEIDRNGAARRQHPAVGVQLLLSPNYPWYFLILTPFVALVGGAPLWPSPSAIFLQQEAMWKRSAVGGRSRPAYVAWRASVSVARQPLEERSDLAQSARQHVECAAE
jgi:hypothetical protein